MSDIQTPETGELRQSLSAQFLHDLRTPLNQIIGYSEMLTEQAEQEGQPQYLSDLQKIHVAGHDLLSLLNHGERTPSPSSQEQMTLETAAISDPQEASSPVSTGVFEALILVVDDNAMNREVLSRRLSSQGYAVVVAENGREALDVIQNQDFDLVLLDVMMPDMDGFEVLRALKADERLHDIPVIMISALDAVESIVRCVELGAEDYLLKPFHPTLLKARVGASLTQKRAHDREKKLFTDLEESHRRLQEMEQVKDDLTHMIVHDLRTPLASVTSGMRTLEVIGGLNADQQEIVAIAISGGDTLLGMINDLLDVEKIESGAMQLDYVLIDAQMLMSSALRQVAQLASEYELRLVNEQTDDLPPFQGDEEKLRRVLVNLLSNAIKFTQPGGTVTTAISLCPDKASLKFSVSDTGAGIQEESFSRIFEKFGQLHPHQNGQLPGTGLGLTFCKLATEAHHGTISVESLPGRGSVFSFTIPLVAAAEQ